jgi:small subunit ribosomal protein S9
METNSVNNQPSGKTSRYIEGVGHRRTSTARVRLYPIGRTKSALVKGKIYKAGTITVNNRAVDDYFPGLLSKQTYEKPLLITDTREEFVITAQVKGGGINGQLGAFVHGLSRALDKIDSEKYHNSLKKEKLFTRDPRMKERRKAGYAGKARAKKQSPKR